MPVTEQERQGYLSNLDDKTIVELKDLLFRQEKLLSKQNFLKTLPDRGRKVKTFAETLEKLIQNKTVLEKYQNASTSYPLHNSLNVINPTSAFSSCQQTENDFSVSEEQDCEQIESQDLIKSLINPAALLEGNKKQIIDNRHSSDTDNLCESLQHVKISNTQPVIGSANHGNVYEAVIRRAEQRPKTKRETFKPNSSLVISKLEDLPEKYKLHPKQEIIKKSTEQSSYKYSNGVLEESAACPPQYKYNTAKIVSTVEAIELIKEQEAKQEELKAQRAAERLAERLNIKMESYTPETTDIYRKPVIDSDDDDEDGDVNNAEVDNGDGCPD